MQNYHIKTWKNPTRFAGISLIVAGAILGGLAAIVFAPQVLVSLVLAAFVFAIGMYDLPAGLTLAFMIYPFVPDTTGLDLGTMLPLLDGRRLIILGIDFAFLIRLAGKGIQLKRTPLDRVLMLFIFVSLLSLVASVDRLASLKSVGEEILLFFGPFYVMSSVSLTSKQIKQIVFTFCISAILIAALGYAEFLWEFNPFMLILPVRAGAERLNAMEFRGEFLRIQSSFGHPIAFALYLSMIVPLTVWLTTIASGWRRIMWFLAALLLSGAILVTFSRGPLLGLAVSLLTLGLWAHRPMKKVAVVLLTVIVTGSLLFIAFSSDGAFFSDFVAATIFPTNNPFALGSSNVLGRAYLLQAGAAAFLQRPLLGFGPGTSASGYITGYSVDQFVVFDDIANYFLLLAVENGILAFGMILLAFYKALRFIQKNSRGRVQVDEMMALRYAIFALVLGYLITLGTVTIKNSMPLFWALLGLGINLAQTSTRQITNPQKGG